MFPKLAKRIPWKPGHFRRLSYPVQPLSEPIPLAGSTIAREKAKSHSSDTKITYLENGLRVASQEAFGQYSTIGGKRCRRAILYVRWKLNSTSLVFVDAGSRYEVNYTSGVSHLLQKLAFQVLPFSSCTYAN